MTVRGRTRLFDDRSRYLDRFGILLVMTGVAVVILFLTPVGEPSASPWGRLETVALTIFVGLTMLLSLRASGVARFWVFVGDVLVGLAVLNAVVLSVFTGIGRDAPLSGVVTPISWTILATFAPVVIVRRVLCHRVVTRRTLMGAVTAYLLLAVAFYYVFVTVNIWQHGRFFAEPQPRTAYMYFSITTITTVGYGDLPPITQLARLMAGTEAILGQVYLVTFVARLVSLLPDSHATPEVTEQD
jgi:hypothetical protein